MRGIIGFFIFYILWKVKQNYSYRRRNIFNSNIFNIYVRGNFILIEKNFIATVILLTTLQYRNFCLLNAHSLQSSSSSIKPACTAPPTSPRDTVRCSCNYSSGWNSLICNWRDWGSGSVTRFPVSWIELDADRWKGNITQWYLGVT